jgi:hypothetical protein
MLDKSLLVAAAEVSDRFVDWKMVDEYKIVAFVAGA